MRFDFEVHVDNMYFLSCLSYVGVKRVELTNNVRHRKKTKNHETHLARLQNTPQLKLFGAATENGYAVGASTRYSKGLGMR